MYKDAYDLSITCSSADALQAYVMALDCTLRFDQSAITELSEAVSLDEEFALAHAVLGRQLFMFGFKAESNAHFEMAVKLSENATPRERAAINIAVTAVSDGFGAISMARAHISEFPNDVFVLAHLVGPFGLLAFSGTPGWCQANVALLQETKSCFREDDWWHLTTDGFFAAEQGRWHKARELCDRAWTISANGNCAHSLAHLHFEESAFDEGDQFITAWLNEYGADSNWLHHLVWHQALLNLECGIDFEAILERYTGSLSACRNTPTPLETLCDDASLYWRCKLAGVEIPPSVAESVFGLINRNFDFCGFAFADVHKAMVTMLFSVEDEQRALIDDLEAHALATGTEVSASVENVARGFSAFCKGDFELAMSKLGPEVQRAELLGGSNPQRRIIEETFIETCIRAGNHDSALDLLNMRTRQASAHDQNLLNRITRLREET